MQNYSIVLEFLGLVIFADSICLLLVPEISGWFTGKRRRFWITSLTYEDTEWQSIMRTLWLIGIVGITLGAIISSKNTPDYGGNFTLLLTRCISLLIVSYIFLKTILLIIIIVSSLWKWCMRGEPLFKRKESIKGNA